jgi:stress response protein YsnF
MSYTSGSTTNPVFPMIDMMFKMQRLGLRAMSMYQPLVSNFLDATQAVERSVERTAMRARPSEVHDTNEEQVVAVGEEVLNVGTRMVPGKTTRVRRVVVESPVQQDVTLHTETVVLERRKPLLSTGEDVLSEVTVEMSDFNEVPVVSKNVRLVEEVLLRKEVTARTETIHDTLKHDKLEIDQPSQLPVVFNAAQKMEEKRRSAEAQDKNLPTIAVGSEPKTGPAAERKR